MSKFPGNQVPEFPIFSRHAFLILHPDFVNFFFFNFRQPWCYCLWLIGKARKYNAMNRQGCFFFFFRKEQKKKKDTHTMYPLPHPYLPHTYRPIHKITNAAGKMRIHDENGTMSSTNEEIMCTFVKLHDC